VRKEPARGYFTTPLITRDQLDQLFEFRRHLEPWAARTAATDATGEGHERLRVEMRHAGDLPRGSDYESYKSLAAHDSRFHALVFDLACNQFMAEAFASTRCHLHIFRLHYGQDFASPAIDEHHRIVEAITAADPDAAQAAMLTHINASYARLASAAR
jgi:DNA-binding GntR family transcriptional regulator